MSGTIEWMPRYAWLSRCLLVLALCSVPSELLASGPEVIEATEEQRAAASAAFKEARAAFTERRFVDALAKFKQSHNIVRSPNTELMIAHTLRELGRLAEAHDAFVNVAKHAAAAAVTDPKYKKTVERAERERAALLPRIGLLQIAVPNNDEGELVVDGRPIDKDRWVDAIAVDSGSVTVAWRGKREQVSRTVEVVPGRRVSVSLQGAAEGATDGGMNNGANTTNGVPSSSSLPAPTSALEPTADTIEQPSSGEDLSGLQIAGLTLGGGAVAAFVVGGVFGGLASSQHADLEDACGDQPCPAMQDDIDTGRTYQTTANVAFVAGGVLAAVSVTLLLTPLWSQDDAASAYVRIYPHRLSIGGKF